MIFMNNELCNTDKEIISFLKTVSLADFGTIHKNIENVEKSGLRRALNRLTRKNYIDYTINGRKFLYKVKFDVKEVNFIQIGPVDKLNDAINVITKLFFDMDELVKDLKMKNSMLGKFTQGIETKHIFQNTEEKIREDEKRKIFTKLSKSLNIPIDVISKVYERPD